MNKSDNLNATQRNATQRNATQRNATQRNATHNIGIFITEYARSDTIKRAGQAGTVYRVRLPCSFLYKICGCHGWEPTDFK